MMLMYYNTEADSFQPDEDVKVKMSFVLNELKSLVQSGQKNERGNAYQKFAHVIDSSWQQPQPPKPEPRRKYNVHSVHCAQFCTKLHWPLKSFRLLAIK